MDANREYKNSVFSLLFSDPDILRELYGALEGVAIDPSEEIIINTLEGALYMKRLNDLSFTIGRKLVVLIEHQSTENPNMPLRLLMYIARVYEKILGTQDVYAKGLIKIPRPEIFVLYNGPDTDWDMKELKLTDAFEGAEGLVAEGASPLELQVKMYNINGGHNEAMLRRSEYLLGFSIFIDKVREHYNGKDNLGAAIKTAVEYCLERNILKAFLEAHSTEVINMLFAEWKDEEALEYRYKEGMREGREEGREEGRLETAKNLLEMGLGLEQIAKGTGLSIETIKEFASVL
jgi:hypothetical protein